MQGKRNTRKEKRKKEMRNLGAGLIVWEKGKSSKHQRESNGRCKERENVRKERRKKRNA